MGIRKMSREFIWQFNQNFNIRRRNNKFKWGIHSAEMTFKAGITQISFYYEGSLVKTYGEETNPTIQWATKQIFRYFDSVYLDREMYGESPEKCWQAIDKDYRRYAETSSLDK